MGPGQASSDTKDFVISQSGDMGIRSLPTDGNALTVGGTGSFAGLVVGGGTFTSASLAAGGSGGSGGSSNFTAAGISGSFGNQRVGTTDDVKLTLLVQVMP